MRRKMLGAILLPLPFAALPVVVVLIGAAFGPGDSRDLVTQTTVPAPIAEYASVDVSAPSDASLASVTSPVQSEWGCEEFDLRAES